MKKRHWRLDTTLLPVLLSALTIPGLHTWCDAVAPEDQLAVELNVARRQARGTEWLQYDLNRNDLGQSSTFTVCLHIYLQFTYTDPCIALTFDPNTFVIIKDGKLQLEKNLPDKGWTVVSWAPLNYHYWTPVCVAVGREPGLALHGEYTNQGPHTPMELPQGKTIRITVGIPLQDANIDQTTSLSAIVTAPTVYKWRLSDQEVLDVASCREDLQDRVWYLWSGRILDSLLLVTNRSAVTSEFVNDTTNYWSRITNPYDMCVPASGHRLVLLRGTFLYGEALGNCSAYGGTLAEGSKDTWMAASEPLQFAATKVLANPWVTAGSVDKCWKMDLATFSLIQGNCDTDYASYLLCQLPLTPTVELRSEDDQTEKFFVLATTFFYPSFYTKDGLSIQGNTTIWLKYYDQYMELLYYAQTNVLQPLGRHTWSTPATNENIKRTMTLTSCSKDEFTCNSGKCIELSKRCDGVYDCGDDVGSDENALFQNDFDYRQAKNVRLNIYAQRLKEGRVGVSDGYEGLVYSGQGDAKILKVEDFMVSYMCDFNLALYPFDIHQCFFNFSIINHGSFISVFLEEVWSWFG
ncbi:putative Low density lipoprotein receptor-related protein-like 1 [Homarus americanus]|uniref:Putative Low density lipoprotein receptor-related protein-like 1 n=1 Tax=Homarus americanus TaxID=6706 RepID=A0A8J5JT01_HOMAM|nr:putative Low density lipoprotein receptor-related protein-like 1 [Homarus americanus]